MPDENNGSHCATALPELQHSCTFPIENLCHFKLSNACMMLKDSLEEDGLSLKAIGDRCGLSAPTILQACDHAVSRAARYRISVSPAAN